MTASAVSRLPEAGQIWQRRKAGAMWHAELVIITDVTDFGVRGMRADGTMTPLGAYAGRRWFAEHFEDVTVEMRELFLDQLAASLARQQRLLHKLGAQVHAAERLLHREVTSCAR